MLSSNLTVADKFAQGDPNSFESHNMQYRPSRGKTGKGQDYVLSYNHFVIAKRLSPDIVLVYSGSTTAVTNKQIHKVVSALQKYKVPHIFQVPVYLKNSDPYEVEDIKAIIVELTTAVEKKLIPIISRARTKMSINVTYSTGSRYNDYVNVLRQQFGIAMNDPVIRDFKSWSAVLYDARNNRLEKIGAKNDPT